MDLKGSIPKGLFTRYTWTYSYYIEFCEATPFGLVDESKESLYGRETDRDLRSACRCVTLFLFCFLLLILIH